MQQAPTLLTLPIVQVYIKTSVCACPARRIESLCQDRQTFLSLSSCTHDVERYSARDGRLHRRIHSTGWFSGHQTNGVLCGSGQCVAMKELTLCLLWVGGAAFRALPYTVTEHWLSHCQLILPHQKADTISLITCPLYATAQSPLGVCLCLDYHHNYGCRVGNPKPIHRVRNRVGFSTLLWWAGLSVSNEKNDVKKVIYALT